AMKVLADTNVLARLLNPADDTHRVVLASLDHLDRAGTRYASYRRCSTSCGWSARGQVLRMGWGSRLPRLTTRCSARWSSFGCCGTSPEYSTVGRQSFSPQVSVAKPRTMLGWSPRCNVTT